MIPQAASYYAMGFVMWFIGFGCGALLAYCLRSRYYDREIAERRQSWAEVALYEWRRANQAEERAETAEAQLESFHNNGRP